jgi:hypothetical protein
MVGRRATALNTTSTVEAEIISDPLTPCELVRQELCKRGKKLLEQAKAIRDASEPLTLPFM